MSISFRLLRILLLVVWGTAIAYAQPFLKDSIQYYEKRGEPLEVLRIARQMRQTSPHDSLAMANGFYYEGTALRTLSRLNEAESAFREALRWAPAFHSDRIDILSLLGAVLTDEGDLIQADSLLRVACGLAEILRDTTSLERLLTSLAYNAYYRDDFEAMATHSRRLLQMVERSFPEKATLYYAALTNMGLAFLSQGRAHEAEPYLRLAWERAERYPPAPRILGAIAENLGIALNEQDRSDEALYYYWQAENLYRKVGDSLALSHLYNNIAKALSELGDLRAGNQFLLRAASIVVQHAGESSPVLPNIYLNIAWNALQSGELDTAETYGHRALEIARQLNAPVVEAYIQVCVGDIQRRRGHWTEARQAYEAGIPLVDSLMASGNPVYPILLTRLGLTALQENALHEAEAYLHEAGYRFTRYIHSSISPYSPDILTYQSALAGLEERKGHTRQADSIAVETVRRSFVRMLLYLAAIEPARRTFLIDGYFRPFYTDLQRRVAERDDSALTAFGFWAGYAMEFLETFMLADSMLPGDTARAYLARWKICIRGYHRAEREGDISRAESLFSRAQVYQAQLWRIMELPPIEEAPFHAGLRNKIHRKDALLKLISIHTGGQTIQIGYVAYLQGKRLILRRTVSQIDETIALPADFAPDLKTVLPRRLRRLYVFAPITLPDGFQETIKDTTGATVILSRQSRVWNWLASR